MNRTNLVSGAVAIAVVLMAIIVFGLTGGSDEIAVDVPSTQRPAAESPAPEPPDEQPAPIESEQAESAEPFSDLPTIHPADLPPEAIDTLLLIVDGGPYPYRQDDEIFQNREGILPDRDLGHYREYTVDTPGSDDRGARRIVAGADGELYYTDDHYDSFREIVP